jgi:hypothetical protein
MTVTFHLASSENVPPANGPDTTSVRGAEFAEPVPAQVDATVHYPLVALLTITSARIATKTKAYTNPPSQSTKRVFFELALTGS